MKKTLKSRTLLLIAAILFFVAQELSDVILYSGAKLIGVILLLMGIIAMMRETKAEKRLDIK